MKVFSIANLTSNAVQALEITSPPGTKRPHFANKDTYRRWCADATTRHSFISQIEGVQPGVRVSIGNPPALIHGLTLEYDAELVNEWVPRVQKVSAPGLCPVWGCRSFSGNGRLFFPLERPLGFVNVELWQELTQIAFGELIHGVISNCA